MRVAEAVAARAEVVVVAVDAEAVAAISLSVTHVKLRAGNGNILVASSRNKGALKLFQMKKHSTTIPCKPYDVSAIIVYKNGKRQKQETTYGSSFLSQSARVLTVDNKVTSVDIKNNKGEVRQVDVKK